MAKLRIKSQERRPRVFRLALEGRLDTETCPQLEAMVDRLLASRAQSIELNMAELDYISSMGLGIVFQTMKRLKAEGGKFAVTNLRPHVHKVFEITKMLPSEKIFSNAAEADRYFDTIQRREKKKAPPDGGPAIKEP